MPSDHREGILGDLEETFASRSSRGSRAGAWCWFWAETLKMSAGFSRERWRPAPPVPEPNHNRGGFMRGWMTDVRFAWKMAAKNPWMTGASVLALGAAMAVTIGGFSLLWSAYYAALPFDQADRIVAVRDVGQLNPDDAPPRLAVVREWQDRQRTFDVLGATFSRQRDIADGAGGLARYPVASMTASGFAITGVQPLLGRTLNVADEAPVAQPVVVIGYRAWQTLFAGDPTVVGRILDVGGDDRQVVGVMPDGFRFPVSDDFWIPLDMDPTRRGGVEPRWLRVFGRLAEGVSIEEAAAELDALRAGYAMAHPEDAEIGERRTTVVPYVMTEQEPGTEILFFGMFIVLVLVLVIACASVANLLLSRATSRGGELAVRAAMGASRSRLVRQLLVEAFVLTSAGALVGIGVARVALVWFGSSIPVENIPFWVEFGMNLPTVVFAVGAAFVAALVAGVAPALKATGGALHGVLKDEQRSVSGIRFGSISGALTVVEVALSVAFLAAAALAAQSLLDSTSSSRRLPTTEILVSELALVDEVAVDAGGDLIVPDGAIPAAQWPTIYSQVRAAAEALPGVRTAVLSTTFGLPAQQHSGTQIELEADIEGPPTAGVRVLFSAVSPELFTAFDGALMAGRNFDSTDAFRSESVAIVNASFARRFFGNRNPVGSRFRQAGRGEPGPWLRIVGISEDLKMNPSGGEQAGFYRPFAQVQPNRFMLALRLDGDPLSMSAALKDAVKGVDERIDIAGFETHEEMARSFTTAYQMMSMMFAALGGTALFLSLAGLYAVMSFSVTQRTREIGIRVALGGSRWQVVGAVLRRGLRQIALGVAVGTLAGWGLLGLISFIPIGVSSGGTLLLVAAATLMLAAGLGACIVPASRALRIHPVEALRHD